MNPACLLICNDIADQAQTQFDHWYQTEHLAERLAVPGFSNARRYAAVKASHCWAALYELDNTAVLNSLAYLERLAQPSELTRAVMPHFRRMVRSGLEQHTDVGQGCGGVQFATLMPMRAIPFKLVCLLGMNDSAYPRSPTPRDFELISHPGRQRIVAWGNIQFKYA